MVDEEEGVTELVALEHLEGGGHVFTILTEIVKRLTLVWALAANEKASAAIAAAIMGFVDIIYNSWTIVTQSIHKFNPITRENPYLCYTIIHKVFNNHV